MRKIGRALAVVGAVVLSVPLCSAGGVGAAESDPVAPEWLFATDAADVTITKAGSGFLVTLPARERVTAFTDRPNRQTDMLTLREFAKDWKAYGFDTDPPNAALLLETGPRTRTSVVEMSSPRVKNGNVTFRLTPIDGSQSVAGHTHKHTLKPATYDYATLFIDDGELRWWGVGDSSSESGWQCIQSASQPANYEAGSYGSEIRCTEYMNHLYQ